MKEDTNVGGTYEASKEESKVEPAFIVSLVSHLVSATLPNDLKPDPVQVILSETETGTRSEDLLSSDDIKAAPESASEIKPESNVIVNGTKTSEEEEEKEIKPESSHPEEAQLIEFSDNVSETILENKPEPNIVVIEGTKLNSEPESKLEPAEKQALDIVEPDSPDSPDQIGDEAEMQSEVIITLTKAESEVDPAEEVKREELEILDPEFITSLVAHRVPIVLDETTLENNRLDGPLITDEVNEVESNANESWTEITSEPDGEQQDQLEDDFKVEASHPEDVVEAGTSQVENTSEANQKLEIEEQTVRPIQIIRDTQIKMLWMKKVKFRL